MAETTLQMLEENLLIFSDMYRLNDITFLREFLPLRDAYKSRNRNSVLLEDGLNVSEIRQLNPRQCLHNFKFEKL